MLKEGKHNRSEWCAFRHQEGHVGPPANACLPIFGPGGSMAKSPSKDLRIPGVTTDVAAPKAVLQESKWSGAAQIRPCLLSLTPRTTTTPGQLIGTRLLAPHARTRWKDRARKALKVLSLRLRQRHPAPAVVSRVPIILLARVLSIRPTLQQQNRRSVTCTRPSMRHQDRRRSRP